VRVLADTSYHGVFTSDNGGLSTSEGQSDLEPAIAAAARAGPTNGGIREPWIVRAPGLTKAGSVCDTPVISTGFLSDPPRTSRPAPVSTATPGRREQLFAAAPGKETAARRAASCWHYPH